MRRLGVLFIAIACFGCSKTSEKPDLVWGKRGVMPGDFTRPRACVIDGQNRLWIVDFTARVQAYDLNGKHLEITFTTPDFRNGRPSGLGLTNDGQLIVCDSHYHCVRIYDASGTEIKSFGGATGTKPGQWAYVSDCVQDKAGNYYVSEFGLNERITKLDTKGKFIKCWGQNGVGNGEFSRIRALALGPDDLLYVCDACNHRIQAFTLDGEFVKSIGEDGEAPGQLKYPYDISFGPQGDLYVAERGNHRVQRFTRDGQSKGVWGKPGRAPGQLADPWALAVDHKGRVHIIDTENHRVQRLDDF